MFRIFMSAYRKGRPENTNRRMHGLLMQRLLLMYSGPEMVLGRYQGEQEVSITFGIAQEDRQKVAALLREFEQECALVVDASGYAQFLFPDGQLVPCMGFLREVQEYPEGQDYSFFRGKWFILHRAENVGVC